jgi:hypothetical protein
LKVQFYDIRNKTFVSWFVVRGGGSYPADVFYVRDYYLLSVAEVIAALIFSRTGAGTFVAV